MFELELTNYKIQKRFCGRMILIEYSFSHRDCNDESLSQPERNNLDVIGENKKREKTNLSNH